MNTSPLPLAVIVVSFNAGDGLRRLVESLEGHCAQLLLVDNASTDGSLENLPSTPNLTLLKNQKNLGYARAVNQALDCVNQPWTLLLNPDCRVEAGVLHTLIERMERHDAVVAGVCVLNPDGSEQRASRRNLPTFTRLWREVLGLPGGVNVREQATGIQPVEAVSGAFVCLRTEVFRELDGLDNGYFLHCEDLDLFARLKQRGIPVWWYGDLQVVHEKGTADCAKAVVEQHKHAGMLRYFNRHMVKDWPWGLRTAARQFIRLHGGWVRLKLALGWQGVRR